MPSAPRGLTKKPKERILGSAARWRGVHQFMDEHLWRDVTAGELKAFASRGGAKLHPKAEFVCEDKSGELTRGQELYRKRLDPKVRGARDHKRMENHTNNTTNTGATRKRAVSLTGGVKSAFAALASVGVTPDASEVKVQWGDAMVRTTLDQVCVKTDARVKTKQAAVVEVKTTGNFERQGVRDSVLHLTNAPITRQDKYFFQNLINEILYEKTFPGVQVVDNLVAVTDGHGHARVYRMPPWIRDLKDKVEAVMKSTRLSRASGKQKIKTTPFMSRRGPKTTAIKKTTRARPRTAKTN